MNFELFGGIFLAITVAMTIMYFIVEPENNNAEGRKKFKQLREDLGKVALLSCLISIIFFVAYYFSK